MFGTKPAQLALSMLYFNDRTRFRSLCRRRGGMVTPLSTDRGKLLPLDSDSL
jgi:hypothetical protein